MPYRVRNREQLWEKEVLVYDTEVPTSEGRFAFCLIERWGMISSIEDGEDRIGRQKGRLLPVEEVVDRAFDMAHVAFREARFRRLMEELPDLNRINAEEDEKRKARKEERV